MVEHVYNCDDRKLRELGQSVREGKRTLDRRLEMYSPLDSADKTKDFLYGHFDDLAFEEKRSLADCIWNGANYELRELVQHIRAKQIFDARLNEYTPLDSADKIKEFLDGLFDDLASGEQEKLAQDVSKCANDEELRELVRRTQQIFDSRLDEYILLDPADNTKNFLRLCFQQLSHGEQAHMAKEVSKCVNDEKLRELVKSIQAKQTLDLRLARYTPLDPTDDTKKFLREFIKHLSPNGQENLAKDVGCSTDQTVRDLVKSILFEFLTFMKTEARRTRDLNGYPCPGIDYSLSTASQIEQIQWRLRRKCLERDGYKCVVSGRWSFSDRHPDGEEHASLEIAHIIPFTQASFPYPRDDDQSTYQDVVVWVILNRYFPELHSRLNFSSEHFDSEKNAMMLACSLHWNFWEFSFIFEATAVPRQYRIVTFDCDTISKIYYMPRDGLVTFRSNDERWPLPDPILLGVHAAIGKFLNLSGYGKKILTSPHEI